jgi:hypothetical protein
MTFFSVAALFGVVMPQLGRVEELKNEISSLRFKISEMEKSGGTKSGGSVKSEDAPGSAGSLPASKGSDRSCRIKSRLAVTLHSETVIPLKERTGLILDGYY